MTQKRLGLALVGALTAAVLVAVLTAAVSGQSGARQTAARPAELTGTWSNAAVVPFERAPKYGNRELLTDAQHKEAVAQLLAGNERPGRDSRESNGQDIRGTEKDVARAYNEHFFGDKPTQAAAARQ